MSIIRRTIEWIKSLSLAKYIVFFILLSFLIIAVTILINLALINFFHIDLTDNRKTPSFGSASTIVKLIFLFLLAPLLETYIFQYGIIKWLLSTKLKKVFIVLISALFFGLSHYYDVLYVLNTFFVGIVLALCFMLGADKKISPFWITAIVHATHNLCIVAFQYMS